MSDSTTSGGGNVLALGVDSSQVERGVQQATAALGRVEKSAESASQAWDGLLDALGETAPRATQAAPPLAQTSTTVEQMGHRAARAAQQIYEATRALSEQRDRAIALGQTLSSQIINLERVTTAQKAMQQAMALPAGSIDDIRVYARVMDDLRQRFNPLYAAGQQYRAELEAIRNAQRLGAITAKEAADAQDRLKASTQAQIAGLRGLRVAGEEAAGGVRLAGHQVTNLVYQLQDASVQLSMGQNPLMILMQQGPQAAMAVGGSANAMRLLREQLTLGNVALGAAGLAIGGFVVLMEKLQATMSSLRSTLRATRDDYAEMAKTVDAVARQVGGTAGISTSGARDAATAIAGARGFSGSAEELRSLTRMAGDLARVMNVDMKQAGETFAKAISDPAAVARELAQTGMFGFNDAIRRNVEQLVAQGEKAKATAAIFEQYERRIQGAADDIHGLERAWRLLKSGIDAAVDSLLDYLKADDERSRRLRGQAATEGVSNGSQLIPRRGTQALPPLQIVTGETMAPEMGLLRQPNFSQQDVEAAVRAQAARMGIEAGFAAGIARYESGFRQFNRDGSLVTSRTGALGIMQLMPGTAGELGVNPRDPVENIIGGLRYLQALLRAAGGDQSLAAAGYNAGPTRLNQFLNGGRGLPDETLRYIGAVGATGQLAGAAGQMGRADEATRGFDGRTDRLALLGAQQRTLEGMLGAPELDQAGEAAQRYRDKLEDIRRQIIALETPAEQMTRRQKEEAELWARGAGAARQLAQAEQEAAEAVRRSGGTEAEQARAAMAARVAEQAKLNSQLNDHLEVIGRDTEATQAQAAAMMEGVAAMNAVADRRKAESEALKYGATGTQAYLDAVDRLTEGYQKQRAAAADLATAQQVVTAQRNLDYLKAEVALVGESVQVRERELAALRVRQDILGRGGDVNSEASRRAQEIARATADMRGTLERSQSAFNDLAAVGEQAFSRIGQAITTALVNGQLSTLKFGNIVKGVMSEIVQYFAKIAILNPILNGLFGKNLGTIGDLFGGGGGGVSALSGLTGSSGGGITSGLTILGGAGGGGWGGGGSIGTGGIGSLATSSSSGGGLFSNLGGVFNIGSGLSKAWSWLQGGASRLDPSSWTMFGSGFQNLMGTPLWSVGDLGAATNAAIGTMGGAYGPATPAMVASQGASVTSLGSLLGGVGAGMAAGSLTSMLVGGLRGTVGPGGTIGAAGGAVAGALIGSVIPVIGTILGGIIGGALGGGGGALFGPTKKGLANRAGVAATYSLNDEGMLYITDIGGKRADVEGFRSDLQSQFDELNNAARSRGLRYGGAYSAMIGAGKAPGRAGVPTEVDLNDLANRLYSDDPNSAQALNTMRFTGRSLEDTFKEIDWVKQVYEPAVKAAQGVNQFDEAMKAIDAQFRPTIEHAQQLGLATDVLSQAMEQAKATMLEQRALTVGGINMNIAARAASVAGDTTGAALIAYDQQSRQEIFDTREKLKALGIAADQVADTMARLTKVQEDERAAILKKIEDQKAAEEKAKSDAASATAGATIYSFADFARGLRTSDASPLSAQSQYALASSQFDDQLAKAIGGDWTAMSGLQGYAGTLLSTGRNLYGSGTAYVDVFNRVVDALERVAQQPAEQLTASVLRAETRTQTDVLKGALESLTAEVTALRREVQQAGSTPSRLAA